jgi:hypothetical protein
LNLLIFYAIVVTSFSSDLDDTLMAEIAQCKPLLGLMKTFSELNLDFFGQCFAARQKAVHAIESVLCFVCAWIYFIPFCRFLFFFLFLSCSLSSLLGFVCCVFF